MTSWALALHPQGPCISNEAFVTTALWANLVSMRGRAFLGGYAPV